MQCCTRSTTFAHYMLTLDPYHFESSSLQLKSHTLGLQQKLLYIKLFNLKLCYKIFHHCKYILTNRFTCISLNLSTHRARSCPASCFETLCCNHVTYCLFESASHAKTEDIIFP